MSDEECPGAGKCHGCMSWCDRCGDVDTTCDCEVCDQHHCVSCREMLGRDDAYGQGGTPALCATCSLAGINDDMIIRFERAFAHGDLNCAEQIARDLAANPSIDLNPRYRQLWRAWQ